MDPDPESGSAIRTNAGSGSALNQCGSETLPLPNLYLRVGVHPVPDGLLQALHEHQVGALLQRLELGDHFSEQLRQPE